MQIGYRWYDANNVTPLFPFGCGLSYTSFAYSNLVVSSVSPSGQVQIGFDLTNTGSTARAEVPQLYLGFPAAASEPPKLLKGFQRISLSTGQTQHVTYNLTWEDLANWDATARGWIVTPGVFQVLVGASSRDIRLTGSFTVSAIPSSDLANAALHQPVTVSSVLTTNTPGSAAVDGDTLSAWTSAASDPQWIAVDLGLMKDLSRVRLVWNTNCATSFQIQISPDDTNWTAVYSTTNGSGVVEDILVSGPGRYVRMYGTQRSGTGGYSLSELGVFSQSQTPFGGTVPVLPGRILAANFDNGGESVAYYNTTVGNVGGVYRTNEDVGIQATSDTGGGYNVGWLNTGEWLEYTVNPPDPSAIYSISFRLAAPSSGGQLRVRLNGTVLDTINIPNTGGYQTWQTVTLPNVPIQGAIGSQALRLEVLNNGFNINWIEFDRVQVCSTNNIAVNQPSSASSLQSGYTASAAFDGDITTRWSSASSDPQWIQVDLGSVQNIARVRLIWENAFALSYDLQLSTDTITWTNVYGTTNGPGSINDLAALGAGRYVRMYATERGTQYGDSLWEFEVYPTPQPVSIDIVSPVAGSVFVAPSNGFSFTASSGTTNILTNNIQLILNGIDVSSLLTFSGSPSNWNVTFPFLQPNCIYSAIINVTNAAGQVVSTTTSNSFDTFSQTNLIAEAEDFDFGYDQFIDNPVPNRRTRRRQLLHGGHSGDCGHRSNHARQHWQRNVPHCFVRHAGRQRFSAAKIYHRRCFRLQCGMVVHRSVVELYADISHQQLLHLRASGQRRWSVWRDQLSGHRRSRHCQPDNPPFGNFQRHRQRMADLAMGALAECQWPNGGGSVGRSANSANDQRLHQRLKRELLYVRPRARANDTGCLFD